MGLSHRGKCGKGSVTNRKYAHHAKVTYINRMGDCIGNHRSYRFTMAQNVMLGL